RRAARRRHRGRQRPAGDGATGAHPPDRRHRAGDAGAAVDRPRPEGDEGPRRARAPARAPLTRRDRDPRGAPDPARGQPVTGRDAGAAFAGAAAPALDAAPGPRPGIAAGAAAPGPVEGAPASAGSVARNARIAAFT